VVSVFPDITVCLEMIIPCVYQSHILLLLTLKPSSVPLCVSDSDCDGWNICSSKGECIPSVLKNVLLLATIMVFVNLFTFRPILSWQNV